MLSDNGLLQDYIDLQGDISELSILCRENAEMIQDRWEQIKDDLWIRRDSEHSYSSIVLYSEMKGYYLLYKFELSLLDYEEETLADYLKACPPPESILNRRIRELYSLFLSLPLSKAVDRCATGDAEIKSLWLRKHGISGGQE